MAANLILSKESSESEIKAYFGAVLELSKSDNEFPINLDEVWNLVYERKDSTVQIASAHETSTIFSYNGNDILLNQKKSLFLFGYLLNCCTFAVLQIIIYYGQGIFYALKASILKIYREVVSVCHSLWRMIVCSKIGYDFSFSFTNK